MERISFEKAKEMIDLDPACVMLDVREEAEYITGHAEDAVLLPVDEIDADTAQAVIPDKNSAILVYCRTGRRSERACAALEKLGYTNVFDIGGLIGWPYGLT